MADTVTIQVEGLKELEKELLALQDAVAAQKVLKSAMMSASLPMFKDAKANAPRLSDDQDTNDYHIQDHIRRASNIQKVGGKRKGKFPPKETVEIFIGEKPGKITLKDGRRVKLVYGHLLEFGKHPWLRPAFDANTYSFLDGLKKQLRQKLDKLKKTK